MITRYAFDNERLLADTAPATGGAARPPVWIDLQEPTLAEIAEIESEFGINLPSRDEMQEIEVSSRLYQEGQAHFMTTMLVYRVDTSDPQTGEVTFVLMKDTAITIRFASPRAFQNFSRQATTGDIPCRSPEAIIIGLLETIVEREADLIELLQNRTETTSKQIFEMKGHEYSRARRYSVALKEIGKINVLTSRTRESLVTQSRLLTYFSNFAQNSALDGSMRQRIRTIQQDVISLSAHVDYLSGRLTFLMDATIGLVSIEQNQIIKLFSVVAVMLMPPTLIASIYGMNFRHMPELDMTWGYPIAVSAMVVSAIVPFVYFKRKGWL
ncbi:MAG: magnesium transporter CorA family protein [Alphaproteobacteria bacterium]|nr:magnesium transporter CorA family protein [Alphaproteobacteria bacterium]